MSDSSPEPMSVRLKGRRIQRKANATVLEPSCDSSCATSTPLVSDHLRPIALTYRPTTKRKPLTSDVDDDFQADNVEDDEVGDDDVDDDHIGGDHIDDGDNNDDAVDEDDPSLGTGSSSHDTSCNYPPCHGKSFSDARGLGYHRRSAHVPRHIQLELGYHVECPHGCKMSATQERPSSMTGHVRGKHAGEAEDTIRLWRTKLKGRPVALNKAICDRWLAMNDFDAWTAQRQRATRLLQRYIKVDCDHPVCNTTDLGSITILRQHQRKSHVADSVQSQLFYRHQCPQDGCTWDFCVEHCYAVQHFRNMHKAHAPALENIWKACQIKHPPLAAKHACDAWLASHPYADWALMTTANDAKSRVCGYPACHKHKFSHFTKLQIHQRRCHVPETVMLHLRYMLPCPATETGCSWTSSRDDPSRMEKHINRDHKMNCSRWLASWTALLASLSSRDVYRECDRWLETHSYDDWEKASNNSQRHRVSKAAASAYEDQARSSDEDVSDKDDPSEAEDI